jgi:hypothetical protein
MYLNDISSSPEDLSPLSTNGTSHGLQLEHKSIYIYIYIYMKLVLLVIQVYAGLFYSIN